MEDKKVTRSELVRRHRSMELREYALAALYPLTHSGSTAHCKRTEDELAMLPPLLTALCNIDLPTDIASECREATARAAVTPQAQRLQRLISEHGYQRSRDEPRPWKKPWDK